MASEHDAQTRAFYDHESDETTPARRRRAAADWGVGEDIFDRMPSRRFKRADRRAEHHEDDVSRSERRVSGPARPTPTDPSTPPRAESGAAPRYDDWADSHERRQVAPRNDDWADIDQPRQTTPRHDDWADAHERRQVAPRRDDYDAADERSAHPPRRAPAAQRRPARRPAESWTEGDEGSVPVEGKRPIQSWLEPERGESRTIVLARVEEEPVEAPERRTVTITGHPDRMPVPRTQRPPRTAVERIGASPDRIVGYAVLLGFLLVLIAVLTTGQ